MSKQGSGFPQLKRIVPCKIGEGSRYPAGTHFLAHVPFCVPKIGLRRGRSGALLRVTLVGLRRLKITYSESQNYLLNYLVLIYVFQQVRFKVKIKVKIQVKFDKN